jgi:hypothetical protein
MEFPSEKKDLEMTAKQVIKTRCLDCAGFKCTDTGCALYGLMKSKGGAKRPAAIKAYCRWCMNGHPISLCVSPDCGIYQYRRDVGGMVFLPKNSPEKRN